MFSDSRNVQKSVTRIIYLGPLPIGANVKDGGILKFDSILLHSDSVMSCPPALNLKVGKT